MLTGKSRISLSAIAGVTLVELLATMLIGGIAISGLAVAYGDGLKTWRRASEKMVLYSEGSAALSLIERFVKRSSYITTYTNTGVPSRKMDLTLPVKVSNVIFYRTAQFYYFTFDNSLRWNNLTGEFNAFNQKLLPMSNFRYRSGETPYLTILEASFTPVDTLAQTSPSTEGCTSVRIILKLADARGDSLTMSSVVSRRNSPD